MQLEQLNTLATFHTEWAQSGRQQSQIVKIQLISKALAANCPHPSLSSSHLFIPSDG